jgi:hypothetical protein
MCCCTLEFLRRCTLNYCLDLWAKPSKCFDLGSRQTMHLSVMSTPYLYMFPPRHNKSVGLLRAQL